MANIKKGKKKGKPTSPDKLAKTSKKGSVELTEEELGKVSGGPVYIKYQIQE